MAKLSNRDRILESGVGTLFRKGYVGSSVRDIADEAGVPLGSFTNHFRSKETFALQVVDRYFASIEQVIGQTLADPARSPIERLRAYLDAISDLMAAEDWRLGCLLGNFGIETAGSSELLRTRLVEIFAQWKQPFAAAMRDASACGEIAPGLDAEDLAEFLLAGWQGAIMRMKVDRSPEPLQRFRRVVDQTVLARPPMTPEG